MDLCSTCHGHVDKNLFMCGLKIFNGLYNCFMDIMLIVLSIYAWIIFMPISMYIYEILFAVVPC
jgi:hypothetical protein